MKKIICAIMALALLCTGAFAELGICDLYDEAVQLAFHTHNVTLSAEAEFRFDGELFKTMHALYKQDKANSYLSYMLDTVKRDGSLYTGGFSVVGIGTTAYANDTYYGNYYYVNPSNYADTVLTASAQTNAMLALGRTLAAVAAPLETVKSDVSEDGYVYHFDVSDLPEYIDSTVFYLLRDYMLNNYYRYMFNEPVVQDYVVVYYEDWDYTIGDLYFRLFNEKMPEDLSNETDENRYAVAYNWAEQLEQEARANYQDGYVLIRKDGSCEWYQTETECLHAMGYVNVYFSNDYSAVSAWYEEKYGEPLSYDTWLLMLYSPNPELYNLFIGFYDEALASYKAKALAQNPDAVSVYVNPDGSIRVSDVIENYDNLTITNELLYRTKTAELRNLNADVTVNEEGRLTGFKGSVDIAVTYVNGAEHTVSITFDAAASDYDTTYVNPVFDASEYGWITEAEYIAAQSAENGGYETDWEKFVATAPDTVEIMGNTYETMMDNYR